MKWNLLSGRRESRLFRVGDVTWRVVPQVAALAHGENVARVDAPRVAGAGAALRVQMGDGEHDDGAFLHVPGQLAVVFHAAPFHHHNLRRLELKALGHGPPAKADRLVQPAFARTFAAPARSLEPDAVGELLPPFRVFGGTPAAHDRPASVIAAFMASRCRSLPGYLRLAIQTACWVGFETFFQQYRHVTA
jgi:hypothetical protein